MPAIDVRVTRAVEVARDVTDPEEYDAVWQILGQVAEDGAASLRYGVGLLDSPDPVTRSVGCDLLGCACDRHESVRDEAVSALLGLAPAETDADVAWSLACALGRTADERAIPVLVRLAGHPRADVRCQVAQALPPVATGDFDGIEVGVLVRLTGDPDADVRDWATFGLGTQLAVDTPAVRAALWARIRDDSDDGDDVREEAVFGLARRGDPRATAPLIELLDAEEGVRSWGLDAAACLRDPALVPHLSAYDPASTAVATALRECDPAARTERDDFATALLDAVHQAVPAADFALFATRFEPGLTLELNQAGRTLSWSVDAIMDATGGGLDEAARTVTRHCG
ncbi:HEAT repeat domain-containing protein [Actinomadura sp. DC4]|uniref:HEAT repeat domain-containing protein n=1 Tax=Actinomadura sp. DC4 TaxID=3055069 RepID=UPI0025B1EE59|nr:HEAT repeat domain-containing protein [Actinomadura sp. DC4]MDN3353172.1 HEAT repeat domain-containing protein [Actinomadura sp. DC4]